MSPELDSSVVSPTGLSTEVMVTPLARALLKLMFPLPALVSEVTVATWLALDRSRPPPRATDPAAALRELAVRTPPDWVMAPCEVRLMVPLEPALRLPARPIAALAPSESKSTLEALVSVPEELSRMDPSALTWTLEATAEPSRSISEAPAVTRAPLIVDRESLSRSESVRAAVLLVANTPEAFTLPLMNTPWSAKNQMLPPVEPPTWPLTVPLTVIPAPPVTLLMTMSLDWLKLKFSVLPLATLKVSQLISVLGWVETSTVAVTVAPPEEV